MSVNIIAASLLSPPAILSLEYVADGFG